MERFEGVSVLDGRQDSARTSSFKQFEGEYGVVPVATMHRQDERARFQVDDSTQLSGERFYPRLQVAQVEVKCPQHAADDAGSR